VKEPAPSPSDGLRLLPLPALTLRGPSHQFATIRQAWSDIARGVAGKLGLILPEPVWMESSECEVYGRQVLLARIQTGSHSVEDLTEMVVQKAATLLSLSDTAAILGDLNLRAPVYRQEMERLQIPIAFVHAILRLLLKERVSVQDIETILSAVVEGWRPGSTPDRLLERVRDRLGDWLCQTHAARPQELDALTLASKVEGFLKSKLQEAAEGDFLDLDADQGSRFLERLSGSLPDAPDERPVLVCSSQLRLALWRLTERSFPALPVMSWNEVTQDYDVNVLDTIEHKF
jgi:flagellar biosynthesis protein FlhA